MPRMPVSAGLYPVQDQAPAFAPRGAGPLPKPVTFRFGTDGDYLQVGYRANRSMRLYDASSGVLIRTYHFTNQGKELHRFDSVDSQGQRPTEAAFRRGVSHQ